METRITFGYIILFVSSQRWMHVTVSKHWHGKSFAFNLRSTLVSMLAIQFEQSCSLCSFQQKGTSFLAPCDWYLLVYLCVWVCLPYTALVASRLPRRSHSPHSLEVPFLYAITHATCRSSTWCRKKEGYEEKPFHLQVIFRSLHLYGDDNKLNLHYSHFCFSVTLAQLTTFKHFFSFSPCSFWRTHHFICPNRSINNSPLQFRCAWCRSTVTPNKHILTWSMDLWLCPI